MEVRKVKIEKLVSGGYGLGYLDGRVLLVPFSAPGDELLVEVAPNRKGVSWGSIRQILSGSPSRAVPFCPHFGECGGCQLQHISYAGQVEYKRLILDDSLRRLGGIEQPQIAGAVASPENRGYRSRVRFHCSKRRIGFYRAQSKAVVPVENCPVVTANINACLKQFSSYLSENSISGLSEIQMTEDADSRVVLTLEMKCLPDAELISGLREAVDAHGAVARVGVKKILLWGEKCSEFAVGDRKFKAGPGSFFQANTSLLPSLVGEVLSAVRAPDVEMAVELFAGVGVFSIMLSGRIKKLVAVEWNRDSVEDAKANLSAHRVRNVDVLAMSDEEALDLLISRKLRPGLVVLDPPREGISREVCDKLVHLSPGQVIYVSCDPATLARDLKTILASGAYNLDTIRPLDMFPHTAHVETVCSILRSPNLKE